MNTLFFAESKMRRSHIVNRTINYRTAPRTPENNFKATLKPRRYIFGRNIQSHYPNTRNRFLFQHRKPSLFQHRKSINSVVKKPTLHELGKETFSKIAWTMILLFILFFFSFNTTKKLVTNSPPETDDVIQCHQDEQKELRSLRGVVVLRGPPGVLKVSLPIIR
eukprot:gb/GECH01009776.1/.p1 GENE.gb/GECH01009776.1/~~gb/GECH01009776.1/.p1  ORF type:complete len:164 (+),score=3.51 gb/GECH01009776.1/:1-492(+)